MSDKTVKLLYCYIVIWLYSYIFNLSFVKYNHFYFIFKFYHTYPFGTNFKSPIVNRKLLETFAKLTFSCHFESRQCRDKFHEKSYNVDNQ